MRELKPKDFDISTLVVFRTVVEEGGFSKASKKLLITQPAVSLAVRRLEDQIGCILIDRTTRKFLLTEAGHLEVYECQTYFRKLPWFTTGPLRCVIRAWQF